MNKSPISPNKATFVAAVAAIVAAAAIASSVSPLLATTIRESSPYEGNNLMGDIISVAMMFVIVAVSIIVPLRSERNALRSERDALRSERDALRSERNALRSERDALRSERDALRSERNALRSERDALRSERDSYVRFTVALDESLQRKSDMIVSLENKILEWSNRYYSLRSRFIGK